MPENEESVIAVTTIKVNSGMMYVLSVLLDK